MEKKMINRVFILFVAMVFVCNAQNKTDSIETQKTLNNSFDLSTAKPVCEEELHKEYVESLVKKATDKYLNIIDVILRKWKAGKETTKYDIDGMTFRDSNLWVHQSALFDSLKWLNIEHHSGGYFKQIYELAEIPFYDDTLKCQVPKMYIYFFNREVYKCVIAFNDYNEFYLGNNSVLPYEVWTSEELQAIQAWLIKRIGAGKAPYATEWSTKNYRVEFSDISSLSLDRPTLVGNGEKTREAVEQLFGLEKEMFNNMVERWKLGSWIDIYLKNYNKVNGYQDYKWFGDYRKLKNKIGGTLSDLNSRKTLSKDTIIAGKPVYRSYEFINDSLQSVDIIFGKKEYDNSGNESLIISLNAKEADETYNDLKKMLFEKYGICVRKNDDGSKRWGNNWYKWGDNKREKEIVWNLGTTAIVLSMDTSVTNGELMKWYEVRVWYFEPNYLNNRDKKQRDEL
jgi:hypothetical protein